MAKLRVGREVKPRTSRHPRVMAFPRGTALEHQEHAVAWNVRGGLDRGQTPGVRPDAYSLSG
jgi:phage baseplate assembly protein gpV